MGIHLCSSHYPSAVYCQGNKQSGANISFYCSVQFASSVCQRKIMVHRTTVLTEILDLRAFNVLNNKCRITWEIGAKREKWCCKRNYTLISYKRYVLGYFRGQLYVSKSSRDIGWQVKRWIVEDLFRESTVQNADFWNWKTKLNLDSRGYIFSLLLDISVCCPIFRFLVYLWCLFEKAKKEPVKHDRKSCSTNIHLIEYFKRHSVNTLTKPCKLHQAGKCSDSIWPALFISRKKFFQ